MQRFSYTPVYNICIGIIIHVLYLGYTELENNMCIHVYNGTYTHVIHYNVYIVSDKHDTVDLHIYSSNFWFSSLRNHA